VIRDRVLWLVGRGVPPESISVVSFTRASSSDLGRDVSSAWSEAALAEPCPVRVSTLHALALRILRDAGQLNIFPVSPRVLDEWEMASIFDCEFGVVSGEGSSRRRESIRLDHEAFWSTGAWLPPGLPAPEPPIADTERAAFEAYYHSRSALYCYLLPSDITRKCLEYLQAMPTSAGLPIPLRHLIVDEYQDLNPVDIDLIREIQQRGAHLFASGDDDQSVYFFRYALPAGIQRFDEYYPRATTHVLQHCFRCPAEILDPALGLMTAHAPDTRIPKEYIAVPSLADPPVVGRVERWYFRGQRREADAIAHSCRGLVDAGIPPEEIAILLSSRRPMEQTIVESLDAVGVPYELGDEDRFADESPGRAGCALLRLVVDPDDYVAIRTLVGIQPGVGGKTTNEIAAWLLASGLRYGDVLSWPDLGELSVRARTAIEAARSAVEHLETLQPETELTDAMLNLNRSLETILDESAVAAWHDYAADLPQGITLDETCRLVSAPTPHGVRALMVAVRARLGLPTDDLEPAAVRLMTLHGSKGLTFEVVFIPGLEQGFLPSLHDLPYLGLVQQAARVLYVGITRARLATVLSLVAYRMIQGENVKRQPTPFIGDLSGRFEEPQDDGLAPEAVAAVMEARDARLLE
jgi:DNA helicase-2/ATP-dependent DNA helicase PcrA